MNPFVVVHSHPCGGPEGGEKPNIAAVIGLSPQRRGRGLFPRNLNSAETLGARYLFRATLVHLRQKSSGICAEVSHSLSPFAASRGLAGVFDGHEHAKGKMKCPTRVLKDLTKCL